MIERGNSSLFTGVRECWKKSFTLEDPRYIDHLFRAVIKPEDCFVDVEDGNAAASVTCVPHEMMFNGRVLRVSMISGLCTMPEYRNQGRTEKLMESVLDYCSHNELLTLVSAKYPEFYANYGFSPLYKRTEYVLTREDVKRITNFGCSFEPSPVDMLKVYSSFIKRFNGFYVRDLNYFVNLKKEVAARGGKVVAYYDGKDVIQGYATILIGPRDATIDECIYLGGAAFNKLVNAALQERSSVNVRVSQVENLAMMFPNAEKKDYSSIMVRLNDADLFSRLFGVEVHTVEEAMQLSRKPLNLIETY